MAIAIIYMAKEFNWSPKIQGFVSSSFYFGYLMTQIIGGALTDKFGAAAIWTLFTLLTPISAGINLYILILCRVCLGIGEGVYFPCIHSLISKWFPPQERTRAVSTVSVATFIGMVIAMPISNLLSSSQFGWKSIFWVFSIIGFIWSVFWYFYGKSDPRDYSGISKDELDWILGSKSISKSAVCSEDNLAHYQSYPSKHVVNIDDNHDNPQSENDMLLPKGQKSLRSHKIQKIPWKLLFSRREVWAIMIGHWFNGWGFFILVNWLPVFYYEHFHVDINLIGYYTALPYILFIITGVIVGYICDYAINQLKIRVITVRKTACIIAGSGLSLCLLLVTYWAKTSYEGLLIMTIGYALYSFYISGLDIAPKYAGVICGIGSTCGLIPAFFGVALTGWILEVTNNDWSIIW
ncbi:3146_t:CDS:2, partial [Racocetra persica]